LVKSRLLVLIRKPHGASVWGLSKVQDLIIGYN